MSSPHPIIVVTGANSGVGLGICHRLLVQLSRASPPDAFLRASSHDPAPSPSPFVPAKGLTLILACRSAERANAARQHLMKMIYAEVACQKKSSNYDGQAEEFCRGLQIDCLSLDLASMDSIFEFAEEVNRRYPYITHLILNAGMAYVTGFDWITVFKQLATGPVAAITTPRFVIQRVGAESPDGLGLVWQSNVFGHYTLSRLLEPLLLRNPYLDSRVEWLTSLDALPEDYDPSDPQLRDAKFSYQASKYQIDLICATLDRAASKNPVEHARIRHLLVHPGICHTNIVASTVGFFLELTQLLCFYLVRFFGSQDVLIQPYKGAIAAVYAGLAPTTSLQNVSGKSPRKHGSRATFWGKEYVGIDSIMDWEENVDSGASLVRVCERLFIAFVQKRGHTLSDYANISVFGGASPLGPAL